MEFKLSGLTDEERRLYIPLVMMSEDFNEARQLIRAGADIAQVIELINNGLGYVHELEEAVKRCKSKVSAGR